MSTLYLFFLLISFSSHSQNNTNIGGEQDMQNHKKSECDKLSSMARYYEGEFTKLYTLKKKETYPKLVKRLSMQIDIESIESLDIKLKSDCKGCVDKKQRAEDILGIYTRVKSLPFQCKSFKKRLKIIDDLKTIHGSL